MAEKLEVEGIIDNLTPRYKKIEVILSRVSDEDFKKLLSAGRIKITIIDD